MKRALHFLLAVLFLTSTTAHPQTDYRDDPAFQKKLQRTVDEWGFANRTTGYVAAFQASGDKCDDCLRKAALYAILAKDFPFAEKLANQALNLPYASNDSRSQTFLIKARIAEKGDAYTATPEMLTASLGAVNQAIALSPSAPAVYEAGIRLALLGKDSEAKSQFDRVIKAPDGAAWLKARAKRFLENVSLAKKPATPYFKGTTTTGRGFSTDSFLGQTVLLILCRATNFTSATSYYITQIPRFNSFLLRHRGEPVLIVSAWVGYEKGDATRAMAKYPVAWPQAIDTDDSIVRAFEPPDTPYYAVIAPDGSLVGTGMLHDLQALPLADDTAAKFKK